MMENIARINDNELEGTTENKVIYRKEVLENDKKTLLAQIKDIDDKLKLFVDE